MILIFDFVLQIVVLHNFLLIADKLNNVNIFDK